MLVQFTADLTIMEEGNELLHRVKTGGVFPMMTSCCPGWISELRKEGANARACVCLCVRLMHSLAAFLSHTKTLSFLLFSFSLFSFSPFSFLLSPFLFFSV